MLHGWLKAMYYCNWFILIQISHKGYLGYLFLLVVLEDWFWGGILSLVTIELFTSYNDWPLGLYHSLLPLVHHLPGAASSAYTWYTPWVIYTISPDSSTSSMCFPISSTLYVYCSVIKSQRTRRTAYWTILDTFIEQFTIMLC